MKKKTPLYVHKKVAKGRAYYYFDTGLRDDRGNRILKRLPDIRAHGFGAAYQAAKAQRTKNAGSETAKSFDWLVRLYERSPEFRSKAENTQRLYSRHLAYANENFRNKHGRSAPLELLTSEHLGTLKDKFADAPGKANAILKSVGALYAWAKKPGRRYVKENIALGIEPFEMGEHEPWEEWLIEEALEAEDKTVRLGVALLYFAGQRIGDTVGMGRGHIVRGALKVKQQKTGIELTIPIHERLAKIIEECAPKDSIVFLVNERGKPLTESGLRQRIQAWATKRKQKIVPHGLRKNAVNALLVAGCSVAEVSAITGQDLQTIEHYAKRRDRAQLAGSAILKFERRNKA